MAHVSSQSRQRNREHTFSLRMVSGGRFHLLSRTGRWQGSAWVTLDPTRTRQGPAKHGLDVDAKCLLSSCTPLARLIGLALNPQPKNCKMCGSQVLMGRVRPYSTLI